MAVFLFEKESNVMPTKKAPKDIAENGKYSARYVQAGKRVIVRYYHDQKTIAKSKVPAASLKSLNKQMKSIKPPALIERDDKGRITKGVAQDTNKNNTAGAPSKYDPDYCSQMIKFFDGEKYREVIAEKEIRETKQGRTERTKYKWIANDLPHLEAFARSIGVTYSTLYNWAHDKDDEGNLKNPEFFEAYNTCKQLQKEFVIENGLKGHYPPASFIFVAKNITDMKDTKDVKIDKPDEASDNGVSDAELEEALFG